MADSTWPSILPAPEVASYTLKPEVNISRQEMEFGTARVRRTDIAPMCDVDVNWGWSTWRQMMFEGFDRWKADEGEAWFDIQLAFPGGPATVTARFKGELTEQPLTRNAWQVATTLEVASRPVMSNADLTAILGDAGQPPAWPANYAILPLPVWDNYSLAEQSKVVRTGQELRGLPQQRRRSFTTITGIKAQWVLTDRQAAIFDAFVRWRARDGACWFAMPVFGGIGLWTAQTRFMGDVSFTALGAERRRMWAVEAPVEIRERLILSEADYEALLAENPEALFAAIWAFHVLIHGPMWRVEP